MAPLARFVTGRKTKWVVLGIWIVAVVLLAGLSGKVADIQDDSIDSQLPPSAQSTEVFKLQKERFKSGQTTTGLIVYERKGGLNGADRQLIAKDAQSAKTVLGKDLKALAVPFGGGEGSAALVSKNGELAYTVITVPNDFQKASDWGKDLRDGVEKNDRPEGLNVYVSGNLGLFADFTEAFGDLDAKLLTATVILVITLLLIIYRSVVMPFIPILVVGISYTIALAFLYLYGKSGQTVTGNVTGILPVLMFGVGTDYCLLLVSRYREELHRYEDKHDAMRHALERTGPAIIASGATVILSLLVLVLAEVGGVRTLGPAAAIGVFMALLAGITLLPAILTIFGRVAFWPRKRLVAYDPEHEYAQPRGVWRRLGDRVLQRPAAALALTVLFFGACSLGLLAYKENYSTTSYFKNDVESVDGFKALERQVPAGTLDPTTVMIRGENGPPSDAAVAQTRQTLEQRPGVAAVTPGETSTDGQIKTLSVVFEKDPYTDTVLSSIPALRRSVEDSPPPGAEVLVGGGTATQYDFDKANGSDQKKVFPVALLVIGLILALLLRAIVAPLVLIGSVILSFFGTLGLSMLFFRYVVGDEGIDSSLPTFAFIFLVSLGCDYTIFLMSRVREEAAVHGTREGVLRALTATGPVITSAGIILAGTFAVFLALPLTFLFNIGFMVAVGILLDTFVVRTIMVPAAVELLGDKIWWPSTAKGGGGALRERSSDAHHHVAPSGEPLPAAE
jgi:putative drug exporter of the RND superfamily